MCRAFMASIAYRSIAVRILLSLNLTMGGTWMCAYPCTMPYDSLPSQILQESGVHASSER
ncbi:hypothetical protein BDN71DRAFT_1450861 [Pleurotus eryngii]|uniref:Uncharacterized protein n=1 Tax=Pleurotus eryngii TaxID=5323 RepID=A0A9P5ZVC4_PLEER|nr:hypothetical protein BDN71DRAFT_1450861 [Pleurotus eryngii]